MTANPHQNRVKATGRFDFGTHAEPDIATLRTPPSDTTRQSLGRRAELALRAAQINTEIAVESAAAIASHTRDIFPDAQYLEITADDIDGNGAQVTSIRGHDGRLLAKRGGAPEVPAEVFTRWADAARGDESMPSLTADLQGQAGNLGETMAPTSKPREGNFGVYAGSCTFTLHIDKALDAAGHRRAA